MRGAVTVVLQILAAAAGLAASGGLIGFLIVHFAHLTGAAGGVGWGMVICGAIAGLAAGSSGSPSENMFGGAQMRYGAWGRSNTPLPQSPFQIAIGGILAFGGGIGVLIRFAY